MSERIWFQDIQALFNEYNYNKFFPSAEMTFAEQLNSLLRFAIYFSVLVFFVRKDTQIFFVPIFVAGFTYLLYTVDTKNKQRERFYVKSKGLQEDPRSKKLCIRPTKENPFMNVLVSDYAENPTRRPACNVTEGKTKKIVKKFFDNNLYRDVSDIYDKNASDRNFYTMPSTIVGGDQGAFAQYLYGQGKTCKEANGMACYKNTYRPVAI